MDSDAAAAALARDKAEVARLGEEVRRLRRAGGDTRGRVSALVEEIKAIRKRRIDDANAAANRKRVRAQRARGHGSRPLLPAVDQSQGAILPYGTGTRGALLRRTSEREIWRRVVAFNETTEEKPRSSHCPLRWPPLL